MTSGGKESSKQSENLKRVSDFIPKGTATTDYPTIKQFANIDLKIVNITINYGRSGNVASLLVTIESKGKETVIKITQRKVVKKLAQLVTSLPLNAKFIKGARVWDVV